MMRSYLIRRRPEPFQWNSIQPLPIDQLLWSPPVSISAGAQICYDPETLYIRLFAVEPHIRAELHSPFGEPSQDSCLEFFFSPMPGDSRYFNLEFNPNASMYLGFGHSLETLVRLIPEGDLFHPKASRFIDGWEITYQIPFSFVRWFFPDFLPHSGSQIRGNCYKCGDLTVQPHFFSWNPVTSLEPDFHRPSDFGIMYFE